MAGLEIAVAKPGSDSLGDHLLALTCLRISSVSCGCLGARCGGLELSARDRLSRRGLGNKPAGRDDRHSADMVRGPGDTLQIDSTERIQCSSGNGLFLRFPAAPSVLAQISTAE